jgi:ketosteroid isomerase-like protein
MKTIPLWLQDYVDACNRHDAAAVVAMMRPTRLSVVRP